MSSLGRPTLKKICNLFCFQVLGLGQMTATILVLLIGKWARIITFPSLSWDTWKKISPLPLFYIGNVLKLFYPSHGGCLVKGTRAPKSIKIDRNVPKNL